VNTGPIGGAEPIAGAEPLAGASTRPRRRGGPGLGSYFWLVIVLLYIPIGILFLFSLNANTTLSFPLKGFTLEWFAKLFATPALLRAVGNSLQVAIGSSIAATVLGAMIAILLSRFEFRGKGALTGLAVMPLIVPYVVLGVALLILFKVIGIPLSLFTVAAAHAIVALPYTVLIILARLVGFDAALEEAAMDLGATYPATLRLVVLPIAVPALISAWVTAFTVSFDEFALALFLAGKDQTFPVYLYGQLRFATTLPVLIATAVLLMVSTLSLILVTERIRRR
jgi:spermidine/putrescine transport system permease protein